MIFLPYNAHRRPLPIRPPNHLTIHHPRPISLPNPSSCFLLHPTQPIPGGGSVLGRWRPECPSAAPGRGGGRREGEGAHSILPNIPQWAPGITAGRRHQKSKSGEEEEPMMRDQALARLPSIEEVLKTDILILAIKFSKKH